MSLGASIDALAAWFVGCGVPETVGLIAAASVVYGAPLLLIILPIASLGQIVERKLAAAMQRRLGPNTAGMQGAIKLGVDLLLFPCSRLTKSRVLVRIITLPGVKQVLHLTQVLGIGQLVADGAKMLGKEDLVPAAVDAVAYRVAPYLAIIGAFAAFAVLPWSQHLVPLDLSVGVVYITAVTGLVVVALLLAGWGSNNKYALLGGVRAVSQLISYELPVALSLAGVVLWSGTMNLSGLVAQQYHDGVLSFLGWNLIQSPFMVLLAGVFLTGALAECQRTPFDMAEAESELVSGFNVEYSGLRWGLFALGEYTDILLAGGLFAILFLGGYQSPIGEAWIVSLPPLIETLIHATILVAKICAVLVFFVWIRWTLPRYRVDQVMRLAWTTLTPLALVGMTGLFITMLVAGVAPGGAMYGQIPIATRVDLGFGGIAWSWLVAGGALLLVILAARRWGADPVHPALKKLTGAA